MGRVACTQSQKPINLPPTHQRAAFLTGQIASKKPILPKPQAFKPYGPATSKLEALVGADVHRSGNGRYYLCE